MLQGTERIVTSVLWKVKDVIEVVFLVLKYGEQIWRCQAGAHAVQALYIWPSQVRDFWRAMEDAVPLKEFCG
jgi:hypothetical protein